MMDYTSTNSGGGYMDTSFDGSSSNTTGYTRKPMGEQTLRPLTIKQIKNCTIPQESTFRVDNADITQITFVGVIRNIQEMATNFVYTIEDGTGAIDVRKWVEQNESVEDADSRRGLLIDTYVRVNGRLNSFSNRVSVVSHSIRPITDFNEITYHLLDAIQSHLTFAKPSQDDAMNIDGTTKANSIHDRVNEIIKSFESTVEGASIDQICYKLKDLHTESEVRDSIEYLQNEGQCYTTIDNDHIKSCLP